MGPTILVVHSDDDERAILRAALQDYGYRVFEASGGEEGLQLAERLRPELVIGDFPIDVPGHSPFVDALRKEIGSDAPVLAVPTRSTIAEIETAHAVSDAVLTELTPARVVEEVQKLLAKPRQGRMRQT